jgi:tRNA-(ms[2]io[6]A)-hydroxylase
VSAPSPPDKKRHLTVLREPDVNEEDIDRPPWHWAGIGAVGVFVLWFPLVLLVSAVSTGPSATWGALHAASFALASFTSGFVVGRFGGVAGKREAMVGGASAGAIAWLVAVLQGAGAGVLAWALVLAVLTGVGAAAARAGGALGVKRREPPP